MFMSSFIFVAGGPKNINNIFGYRTGWSMINKDTWAFAHEFCGKLWMKFGGIFILASGIIMLCLIKTDQRVFVSVAFAIFFAEFVTYLLQSVKLKRPYQTLLTEKETEKSNFIFMYKLFAKYQ